MAEIEQRNDLPYLWVSKLTGVLSGDDQCWYAPWFRAHHRRYPKVNEMSADDRSRYNTKHAAMMQARAAELRLAGWRVTVENQNWATFHGRVASIGMKPDLIALSEDGQTNPRCLVSDQKSGQPREAHAWQVRIYRFLHPALRHLRTQEINITGEIDYGPTHREAITLTREDEQQIVDAVHRVAQADAPDPVPSALECRFCDIGPCTARVEPELEEETLTDEAVNI